MKLTAAILCFCVIACKAKTSEPPPHKNYYPTYTKNLEDTVRKLELTYVQWACQCANWATKEDKTKAENEQQTLADKSIFVEPADSTLALPDTIGYNGDIVRFTGRFYTNKGYPKNYEVTEEKVDTARVFRYTKYEVLQSHYSAYQSGTIFPEDSFIDYTIDPKKQTLKFYWKDENNQPFRSIQNLKIYLEAKGQKLKFAMNGGMYQTDNSPLGLFIESGKIKSPINKKSGDGNFYVKPNGVFYIDNDNKASIFATENFKNDPAIKYATQSGPILVLNGEIHSVFKKSSTNVNIRNGVGLLPDGRILFVMSKTQVNFYDFAEHFKNAGCLNALYLDGFVSRTYLPSQNSLQTDGNFGVIIGEKAKK